MKIPLLLQANPRIGVGPTVMLSKGSWRIESNHVDSELKITLDSLALFDLTHNHELLLNGDSTIRVNINKPGSEPNLTIYAYLKE